MNTIKRGGCNSWCNIAISPTTEIAETATIIGLGGGSMIHVYRYFWSDDQGQNMAEYALLLAVILVLVIGSVRLIANNFLR